MLRLKVDYQKSTSDYDDPETVSQWSRCGIVCDSNIPEIKYLLEISDEGIFEYELFSRLLILKKEGKIIGYKPLAEHKYLDESQLKIINHTKNDLRHKDWDKLFQMEQKGNKFEEAVELVNSAAYQTKLILDTMHEQHFLFQSFLKAFTVFVQKQSDDEENPLYESGANVEQLQRRMPINDLPAFMRYFKVADEDDEFIEDMCDNLLVLQEDERLMKEGLGFDELLQILKSCNFL